MCVQCAQKSGTTAVVNGVLDVPLGFDPIHRQAVVIASTTERRDGSIHTGTTQGGIVRLVCLYSHDNFLGIYSGVSEHLKNAALLGSKKIPLVPRKFLGPSEAFSFSTCNLFARLANRQPYPTDALSANYCSIDYIPTTNTATRTVFPGSATALLLL